MMGLNWGIGAYWPGWGRGGEAGIEWWGTGGGTNCKPIATYRSFLCDALLPCWRTIKNKKYTTISVFVCLLACLSCFCVVEDRVIWEGLLSRGGRRLQVLLCFPTVLLITNSKSVSNNGKWFEPRSISCLSSVIVRVRVVFRKTVGKWFEPRSISCLSSVIVWVRPVVFRKLIVVEKIEILLNALVVVGDWRFD